MERLTLLPLDPSYPKKLIARDGTSPTITVSRPLAPARLSIGIVGKRDADKGAELFAHSLAGACAKAGAVVISGGAVGIDAAAHRGALAVGGLTFCVSPTAPERVYPKKHEALFAEIEASEGAMIWTFPSGTKMQRWHFFHRNRILAALCDVLVIVQAGARSGSRNAARHARGLGRPVYAVSPPAWNPEFEGNVAEIEHRARVLLRINTFLDELGLPRDQTQTIPEPELPPLDEESLRLFSVIEKQAQHMDEIAQKAGMPVGTALTLLLTLVLENVVVEGPLGHYRRA